MGKTSLAGASLGWGAVLGRSYYRLPDGAGVNLKVGKKTSHRGAHGAKVRFCPTPRHFQKMRYGRRKTQEVPGHRVNVERDVQLLPLGVEGT